VLAFCCNLSEDLQRVFNCYRHNGALCVIQVHLTTICETLASQAEPSGYCWTEKANFISRGSRLQPSKTHQSGRPGARKYLAIEWGQQAKVSRCSRLLLNISCQYT
jgi:hypothetical protein